MNWNDMCCLLTRDLRKLSHLNEKTVWLIHLHVQNMDTMDTVKGSYVCEMELTNWWVKVQHKSLYDK